MDQEYLATLEELKHRVSFLEKEVVRLGGNAYQSDIQETIARSNVTQEMVEIVAADSVAKTVAADSMDETDVTASIGEIVAADSIGKTGVAQTMAQRSPATLEKTVEGIYSKVATELKGAYESVAAPIKNMIPDGLPSSDLHSVRESNKNPDKKKDMENRIGKNLMAIVASVLIFFSLILFAGIAFQYLTDEVKALIMFAVSIAISATGIINMQKKTSMRTFFTALAGCGVGATYICCLASYFIFSFFGLGILAVSLLLWIAITMFLAYRYSDMFVYICNAGLVISTVLITFQFENSLLGFGLYTVFLCALYLMKHSNSFGKDSFYFLQYPVMFLIFQSIDKPESIFYLVYVAALIGVFAFANLKYELVLHQVLLNLMMAFLNILAMLVIAVRGYKDSTVMLYVILVSLLGIGVLYFGRYRKTNTTLYRTIYGICFFWSALLFCFTGLYGYVGLLPYALLLFAGFVFRDVFIRYCGYGAVYMALFMQGFRSEFGVIFWCLCVMAIAAIAASAFYQYDKKDKYIITVWVYWILQRILEYYELPLYACFLICAIPALLMNTKLYHISPVTREREKLSEIIGYVVNGIMIFWGIILIYSTYELPKFYQWALVALVLLIFYGNNAKRIFTIRLPELTLGIYVCLKYTILIHAILYRFEAESFIISIAGIVIAIACIIMGFWLKHKSFRLYGLVLSLICVVKLIIFDIQYDSNLLRPIGFFVAGILCFAISFIYSRLEKNMVSSEG